MPSSIIARMFQAGFDKGVSWTPDGGNAVSLNITGWQASDKSDTPEVTHTGTQGQQAFLAGLKRCPCSFRANLDDGQTPASVGIKSGAKGTLAFTFSQGKQDSIHVIIEEVPYQSEVNGVVSFSVTAKSDAINSSGQVVNSVNFS